MTDGESFVSPWVLLPAGAEPARLIVCERSGLWAAGLRRELAAAGTPVHETRSLAECWEALSRSPASFVVVEITPGDLEGLLQRMLRLARDFPLARVAVVAQQSLAAYEWLMRQAGAVHFTCCPRQLGALARTACRHLAAAPQAPSSASDRIWASLPWAASG